MLPGLKFVTPQTFLLLLFAALATLGAQAAVNEPVKTNWVESGSGLECSAVGIRADGTRSAPLTAIWQGDGVSGEPDRPTFKYINETENGLNVVEFEEFTFRGIRSRLAFEIEMFSKREKMTLTVSQLIYRAGTREEVKFEQMTIKASEFVVGTNYILKLAIHRRWAPQNYGPFSSYQIECRLDWLESDQSS